jgi:hypothetical protein
VCIIVGAGALRPPAELTLRARRIAPSSHLSCFVHLDVGLAAPQGFERAVGHQHAAFASVISSHPTRFLSELFEKAAPRCWRGGPGRCEAGASDDNAPVFIDQQFPVENDCSAVKPRGMDTRSRRCLSGIRHDPTVVDLQREKRIKPMPVHRAPA